jgi:hypothetical protein
MLYYVLQKTTKVLIKDKVNIIFKARRLPV